MLPFGFPQFTACRDYVSLYLPGRRPHGGIDVTVYFGIWRRWKVCWSACGFFHAELGPLHIVGPDWSAR